MTNTPNPGFGFTRKDVGGCLPVDILFADILRDALSATGRPLKRWSRTDWAKQFRLLRVDLDDDQARIEKTLDWLVANLKDPYTPRPASAKGFREKYDRIECAMKRTGVGSPGGWTSPVVKMTPLAVRIADGVLGLGWPAGAGAGLPEAVQRSLDNYAVFLKAFRVLVTRVEVEDSTLTTPVRKRLGQFLPVVRSYLTAPEDFVTAWFTAAHKRVHGWGDWSGEMSTVEFRARKLDRVGRQWSVEWSGSDKGWELFWGVLGL